MTVVDPLATCSSEADSVDGPVVLYIIIEKKILKQTFSQNIMGSPYK